MQQGPNNTSSLYYFGLNALALRICGTARQRCFMQLKYLYLSLLRQCCPSWVALRLRPRLQAAQVASSPLHTWTNNGLFYKHSPVLLVLSVLLPCSCLLVFWPSLRFTQPLYGSAYTALCLAISLQ